MENKKLEKKRKIIEVDLSEENEIDFSLILGYREKIIVHKDKNVIEIERETYIDNGEDDIDIDCQILNRFMI